MEKPIYFLEELKNNRDLKVMFISHNSYWADLIKFANKYPHFKLDAYGESGFYYHEQNLKNYDLFFHYSSGYYNQDDLLYLEEKAFRISNDENKRVSIGYSYMIPMNERKYENISEEMKIVSFKDSIRIEETIPIERYNSSPLILVNQLLLTADELDNQKVKKL